MRRRVREEDGWTVITALTMILLTLMLGLALLSMVDVQSKQSKTQRVGDSSFNLAEGTLNAAAFELARSWPEYDFQSPGGNTAACGSSAQTLTGTMTTPAGTGLADRIQKVLVGSFTNHDYSPSATWKVNVCDDAGGATTWVDSLLTANAFDSNGMDATTHVRRMWIRAQTNVGGRKRAVAGLVQVLVKPTFPANYAALVGGFTSDLYMGVNLITNSAVLSPLTTNLLNAHRLYEKDHTKDNPPPNPTGHLGIRCGVLTGCIAGGAFATLSQTTLSNLLLSNDVNQYASPTALTDDQISQLRRQAQATGTYFETLAANAACLPAGSAGKIVFIEQVGTAGDSTCNISATASAKALVVAKGRINIAGGSSAAGTVTFNGVVYALFRQSNDHPSPSNAGVVTIRDWAKVNGAVYIDYDGRLSVLPPHFSQSQLLTTLGLCPGLLCATLTGTTNILDTLLNGICIPLLGCLSALSPTTIVNGLLAQYSGYGPAIQEDDAIVGAIGTFGSSGTVKGTFRELSPN
jgi:hypothetical protein